MNTTITKIMFVLYMGLMSICAIGQTDSGLPLEFEKEYNSFIENYTFMIDHMESVGLDKDEITVMNNKRHFPYLEKAKFHLQNCIESDPQDKNIQEVLSTYLQRLRDLEEN